MATSGSKDYDCIIALSGGVESVALVHYVVNVLKEKPLCMHLIFQHRDKATSKIINKVRQHYKVDVLNSRLFFNSKGVPTFDPKAFDDQKTPDTGIWYGVAHTLAVFNPQIKKIYYGFNSGLLKRGDDHGDHDHDYAGQLYESSTNALHTLGFETKVSCPIVDFSKLELYNMIDDEVKPFVRSCIVHTKDEACGKCHKCKELQYVKDEYDKNQHHTNDGAS